MILTIIARAYLTCTPQQQSLVQTFSVSEPPPRVLPRAQEMPAVAVEDGVYRIRNAKALESFLTMDVSLARTPTYVFGYNWTDGPTQKWLVRRTGTGGYTLQNIGTKKFLSVKRDPQGGDLVYGTQTPTHWTFWDTKVVASACRLFVGKTSMNIDLHNWGDPTPGTEVELWDWESDNDRPNQCWFPERLDERVTDTQPIAQPDEILRVLSRLLSPSGRTLPESPASLASESSTLGNGTSTPTQAEQDQPDDYVSQSAGSLTTHSTSETATVKVTEDEDFVITTRTKETKTTVVTRTPKPVA